MYILNLQSSTLLKDMTPTVKGEIVHVKSEKDLRKQVKAEQAIALHNNNVATEDALSADVAPDKAYSELWQLLTDNAETLDLSQPKKEERPMKTKASASRAKAESKKAKPASKKGGGAGRKSAFAPDAKITVLAKENPKREGSASFKRFALYSKHKTVESFLKAGGTSGDLRYDMDAKYIKVA